MTEKSGEGTRVTVQTDRHGQQGEDQKSLQRRGPTEPVCSQPEKEAQGAEPQEKAETRETRIERLRNQVRANPEMFKNGEMMLRLLDEALNKDQHAPVPEEAIECWVTAEKESWENRDRWIRSVAELDNVRKRARQETSKLLKYQYEGLARDILPILDNMERALGHAEDTQDSEAIAEGLSMIVQMFKDVLKRYGVNEISAVGETFDPNLHEALSAIPTPDKAPGLVIQEVERGYMYEDRLLRPSKVIISAAAV